MTAALARPHRPVRSGYTGALASLLFGAACTCPLQLVDTAGVRLPDAMAVLAVLGIVIHAASSRALHRSVRALWFMALLTLGWAFAELYFSSFMPSDEAARMILVRWIAAFPTALWLCLLTEEGIYRKATIAGLIAGLLVSIGSLVIDYATFQIYGTAAFGTEISKYAWANNQYRASGIFGHPNDASISTLLVVPFLVGAAEETKRRTILAILALITTGAIFYMTQSRGATIASIIVILLWGATSRRIITPRNVLMLLSVLVALWGLASLEGVSTSDLWANSLKRFSDPENLAENSAGRLQTTLTSINLSLAYPFGLGSAYVRVLEELSGFTATHNGFLQLALLGGIPIALSLAAVLAVMAGAVATGSRKTENWVAVYLCVASLFEGYLFSPHMPIVLLWIFGRFGCGPPERDRIANGRAGAPLIYR